MTKGAGKSKLLSDLSANTVQTGVTQVFAFLIFYITSPCLPKPDFGELNSSVAVGTTLIAFASFCLDVVFVRRLARGQDPLVIAGIHLFHTVIASVVLASGIFLFWLFHPLFDARPYFMFIF